MKKNFILFFIVISLLVLTFLVKEKNLLETKKLISYNELKQTLQFEISKTKLLYKNGKWYYQDNDLPISLEKIEHFIEILSNIRFEDELDAIDQDKKVLFQIKWGNLDQQKTFQIYSFSEITGRLTVALNNKYYRAELAHSTDGLYQSEANLQSRLYSELVYYLVNKDAFYKDNYFYPLKLDITKIDIRDKFQINLKKQMTEPEIYPGLKYKSDFLKLVNELLRKIKITKYLHESDELSQDLGWINIDGSRWLSLFGKNNGQEGTFLFDHKLKKKFEIDSGHLDIFFIKPSYFWSLQPLSEDELLNLNEAEVLLTQGDQELRLKIPNVENFTIKVEQNLSINKQTLTELFKLLFAIDPFEQAYRVTKMDDAHEQKENRLKINIFGHKLYFWLSSGFIHLFDVNSKLVFSYVDNGQSFKSDSINQFLLE